MLYRVKQFLWALTAKLTQEEKLFIKKHLSTQEQSLFGTLKIYEQKHSVLVAKEVAKLYDDKDRLKVIKASLLHDIGKTIYPIGPIRKSIMVLLDHFTKGKVAKYPILPMIKCYYNHPYLGYKLLLEKGHYDEGFLDLIKNHHLPEAAQHSEALKILRECDSKL